MRNSAIHVFMTRDRAVNFEIHEATFPNDKELWIEFDIFNAGDTSSRVGKVMVTLCEASINIEVARLDQTSKEHGVLEAILRYAAGYYVLPINPAPELSAQSTKEYEELICSSRLPASGNFFENVEGH